jgi:hypothetical protein
MKPNTHFRIETLEDLKKVKEKYKDKWISWEEIGGKISWEEIEEETDEDIFKNNPEFRNVIKHYTGGVMLTSFTKFSTEVKNPFKKKSFWQHLAEWVSAAAYAINR